MLAYRNHIYPYLVSRMGDPKPIRELRRRIIPLAQGRVLEIGSGGIPFFVKRLRVGVPGFV